MNLGWLWPDTARNAQENERRYLIRHRRSLYQSTQVCSKDIVSVLGCTSISELEPLISCPWSFYLKRWSSLCFLVPHKQHKYAIARFFLSIMSFSYHLFDSVHLFQEIRSVIAAMEARGRHVMARCGRLNCVIVAALCLSGSDGVK